jgi:hypothetical protein
VQAEFFAVVQDAQVGVFDDDRDVLAGVHASDAQRLPGDHDDAVSADLPLDVDRSGGCWRQRVDGQPDASQSRVVEVRWCGQGLGQRSVGDDVDQMAVAAQGDASPGQVGADLQPRRSEGDVAAGVDGAVDLDDRVWVKVAGSHGGRGSRWRSGRVCAAQPQLEQVLGGEVGRDGPVELAVDEHVHAVFVEPDVRPFHLPGRTA